MEVLWTHNLRNITDYADIRDEDKRKRIYNERLRLLFQGNYINAKKQKGAKIRLQFLGVRVKEPPAGLYNLGHPGADMLVSRESQLEELQSSRSKRYVRQWLPSCDGWVRPWPVRAVSGHSTHPDPSNDLIEIDPLQVLFFSPSMSLLSQLGGSFHATACRNMQSII